MQWLLKRKMSPGHEERKEKRCRSNQSKVLKNQVQEQAQLDRSVPRGGKARNYQQAGMLDGDGIFELKRFSYTVRVWSRKQKDLIFDKSL